MKKLLTAVFCCAFLGIAIPSEGKQYSINLSPFSGIRVSDEFKVSILRGAEYRALLTVEEDYMDYVTCAVSGSTLEISLDERKVPSEVKRYYKAKGTPDPAFNVIIYVPDLLRSVVLEDKAVLRDTEDVFDKARVDFELSGSSSIEKLAVSSLLCRISLKNKAGADLSFTGGECSVEASNSSTARIVEHQSEVSRYNLQGTAKVEALCTTATLNVYTKANCTLRVTGSGDKAFFDINGTSEVDASGFEVPEATVCMSSVCKLSEAAYKTLRVNLNGGSTLYFANEPSVTIENIRSASMTRISSGRGAVRSL
ncbi:MAG: DUF2807 domain-containing protein [Bacteroidales bacterium]|nr:DUF2807 domain-containing protein [Bacteroidales bacterium]